MLVNQKEHSIHITVPFLEFQLLKQANLIFEMKTVKFNSNNNLIIIEEEEEKEEEEEEEEKEGFLM